MYTIACGDYKNPPLLMLHGFTGHASYYYLCFKELSKKFRCYAIDFIGQGSSNRSPVPKTKMNREDVENYLCSKLELWRKTMRIKKMHIMGHSIGGFYIGIYATKYPDRVMQAFFISAAGFRRSGGTVASESDDEVSSALPDLHSDLRGWFEEWLEPGCWIGRASRC